METIVLGGGCFWCSEAIYQPVRGVTKVTPGYAGGTTPQPTYEQVCSGTTGHAEVVQVEFDSSLIPLRDIIEIFFAMHDPTTPNQQGNDVGTQYRSLILYSTEQQKLIIENSIAELTQQQVYSQPIITEVLPLRKFYPAEANHQDYYQRNLLQPYCRFVINPKLRKFKKKYASYLKS